MEGRRRGVGSSPPKQTTRRDGTWGVKKKTFYFSPHPELSRNGRSRAERRRVEHVSLHQRRLAGEKESGG